MMPTPRFEPLRRRIRRRKAEAVAPRPRRRSRDPQNWDVKTWLTIIGIVIGLATGAGRGIWWASDLTTRIGRLERVDSEMHGDTSYVK